ncbi:MAG: hypothetical protein HY235_01390 [Acidobacteria bacterium]|nr:hypothetical protein [Acidobacteriota bacterium]
MRIQVAGTSEPAKAVRTGLAAEGFAVTGHFASYQIFIEETDGAVPEVDGIDCELERQIVNCIARTASTDILLRRPGGIQSDQKIRIAIPKDQAMASRVEQAIIKGFALATGSQSNRRIKWFGRF